MLTDVSLESGPNFFHRIHGWNINWPLFARQGELCGGDFFVGIVFAPLWRHQGALTDRTLSTPAEVLRIITGCRCGSCQWYIFSIVDEGQKIAEWTVDLNRSKTKSLSYTRCPVSLSISIMRPFDSRDALMIDTANEQNVTWSCWTVHKSREGGII